MSDNFSCNSFDCLIFKLIKNESELEDDPTTHQFRPEFTHQIFGESEKIFGYSWIKIIITLSASKLNTLIEIQKGATIDTPCSQPDDVMSLIGPFLKGGYTHDREIFKQELRKEKSVVPPGNLVTSTRNELNSSPTEVVVFHSDRDMEGAKEWIANMQILSPFLIETALPIDFDEDPRWSVFTLYEKVGDDYLFLGFSTVYHFYCYRESLRARISQFMILPPFQSNGLGPILLRGIYRFYRNNPAAVEVVVEGSNFEFQKIRDYVDCVDSLSLNCLSDLSPKLMTRFAEEAKDKLKISRNQAYRVFEILLLRSRPKMTADEQKHCDYVIKRRMLWNIMAEHRTKMEFMSEIRESGLVFAVNKYFALEDFAEFEQLFDELIDCYKDVIRRIKD